jgi:hypothetical protein
MHRTLSRSIQERASMIGPTACCNSAVTHAGLQALSFCCWTKRQQFPELAGLVATRHGDFMAVKPERQFRWGRIGKYLAQRESDKFADENTELFLKDRLVSFDGRRGVAHSDIDKAVVAYLQTQDDTHVHHAKRLMWQVLMAHHMEFAHGWDSPASHWPGHPFMAAPNTDFGWWRALSRGWGRNPFDCRAKAPWLPRREESVAPVCNMCDEPMLIAQALGERTRNGRMVTLTYKCDRCGAVIEGKRRNVGPP